MTRLGENQRGFTITELVIVVVMAGIMAVLIGGVSNVFYGSILRSEIEARMAVDSQIILRNITDELRVASGVRPTNTLTDPFGPPGGWNTDSDNAILIIETPVITSDKKFISDPITGELYKNEIVYFASGTDMKRRVLTDPNAPSNNRFQTCPLESVGTSGCEGPDSTLSRDYRLMEFDFFDQDNTPTLITTDARSIDMSINLGRRIFGAEVEIENNIRMTLRN